MRYVRSGRIGVLPAMIAVVVVVSAGSGQAQAADEGELAIAVDVLRVEAGAFTDRPGASGSAFIHGAISARGFSGDWEYMLGVRFDHHSQFGSRDYSRSRLDYGENYLRWRGTDTRITLGAQIIAWGRVDEISPIDRLGRTDLSRMVVDRLDDRRRAVPAVRAEHFAGDFKFDAVWVPVFDADVMPDRNSVWHPVDTRAGRILGIGDVPALAGARLRQHDHGSGGGGIRVTRDGGTVDYGVSVQRVRQSQPYYRVAPGVLTAVYPYSWVVGGEFEMEKAGATWRLEAAWSSDIPITTDTFAYRTRPAFDLVVGTEFFPADRDTRVTLQLGARKIHADMSTLDRKEIYSLTGEIEHPFGLGRWRADLRFVAGLGARDLYLNPAITYLGIDNHEIFLAGHIFSGESRTLGGYYRKNDSLMLGWRAHF